MHLFLKNKPVKKQFVQYYDAHQNIYSEEHRFLLFKNSKVASTSLWLYMARLLGHPDAPARSINLPFLQGWEIDRYPAIFKAGFVRNPWDRLLSCYLQKQKDNRVLFYERNGLRQDMSFEEFVRAVCAIPDDRADQHFRSQYTFLVHHSGRLIADFIGRFEHMEEDFEMMCKAAALPSMQLTRNNSTKHTSYTEYYTEELAEAVAQRYAIDLLLFGYEFGQPLAADKRYHWKAPFSEALQLKIVQAKNQKLRYGLNQLQFAKPLKQENIFRKIKKKLFD